MKVAGIELTIDELMLDGFAPKDRHRIGDAFRLELSRLLAEQGVPPALAQGGVIERIGAGEFQVDAGEKPEATGIKTAQAIYKGLNR